jgi:hypothetical protein
MEHGDPQEAERALYEGRRRLDRLGDTRNRHEPRIYVAAIRANLERFDEALELCTAAEGSSRLGRIAALTRGSIRLEAGDPAGALLDLQTADLAGAGGNPLRARFDGARAAALARLGRLDEAGPLLEASRAAGAADRMTAALLLVYEVDLAVAAGDRAAEATARSAVSAIIEEASLAPTSTLASMLRRR